MVARGSLLKGEGGDVPPALQDCRPGAACRASRLRPKLQLSLDREHPQHSQGDIRVGAAQITNCVSGMGPTAAANFQTALCFDAVAGIRPASKTHTGCEVLQGLRLPKILQKRSMYQKLCKEVQDFQGTDFGVYLLPEICVWRRPGVLAMQSPAQAASLESAGVPSRAGESLVWPYTCECTPHQSACLRAIPILRVLQSA